MLLRTKDNWCAGPPNKLLLGLQSLTVHKFQVFTFGQVIDDYRSRFKKVSFVDNNACDREYFANSGYFIIDNWNIKTWYDDFKIYVMNKIYCLVSDQW